MPKKPYFIHINKCCCLYITDPQHRESLSSCVCNKQPETVEAMSIEAMAMAGMDYKKCGINFEEWDQHCREQPPLYLEDELSFRSKGGNKGIVEVERMKEKLQEWAKAVASFHLTNEKCTVGCS